MKQKILMVLLVSLLSHSLVSAKGKIQMPVSRSNSSALADAAAKQIKHDKAAVFLAKAKQAYTARPPQIEKAIDAYKEALKFDDDVFTHQRLAQMLRFAQRYAEAEAEYAIVRKYHVKHPTSYPSFDAPAR